MTYTIRKNALSVVCLFLLTVGLAACQPIAPVDTVVAPDLTPRATMTQETQASASTPDVQAYPGPVTPPANVDFGSYPGPEVPERVEPGSHLPDGPLTVPSAKADTGVVHGRLIADAEMQRVLFAGDIYLAPVVYMEGEIRVPFLSLDVSRDPKATLRNRDNEFVVVDVPPGEYGVVIHMPESAVVVSDEEFGFLIVEIAAGAVTDLGDLVVE